MCRIAGVIPGLEGCHATFLSDCDYSTAFCVMWMPSEQFAGVADLPPDTSVVAGAEPRARRASDRAVADTAQLAGDRGVVAVDLRGPGRTEFIATK